jgi:hypothetical protein
MKLHTETMALENIQLHVFNFFLSLIPKFRDVKGHNHQRKKYAEILSDMKF